MVTRVVADAATPRCSRHMFDFTSTPLRCAPRDYVAITRAILRDTLLLRGALMVSDVYITALLRARVDDDADAVDSAARRAHSRKRWCIAGGARWRR